MERESAAEVASRIRRLRSHSGLSQPQLAVLLGVSVASVNRWEHAEARPSALAWRLIQQAETEDFAAVTAGASSVMSPAEPVVAATVSPPPPATNLPIPISSFVGRQRELVELCTLLATMRLLTLTGVGGCGKTRLALELARAAVGDRGQGTGDRGQRREGRGTWEDEGRHAGPPLPGLPVGVDLRVRPASFPTQSSVLSPQSSVLV